MFRRVPLSIIRSFSLYTQQWYMTYADRLLASCQHLVGFIKRIYHNARSPEHQILQPK